PEEGYGRRPAPQPRQRRSGRRIVRRFMAMLALLGVLALIVIAAVVISDSTSSTVVHDEKVGTHDVQTAIDQLRGIVNKYTK
ncbi:MAG: hypothetical protein WAL63_00670, partial [Solirubrobacteraceae bacterium]